jgi:hypothetical protein
MFIKLYGKINNIDLATSTFQVLEKIMNKFGKRINKKNGFRFCTLRFHEGIYLD